MATKNRILGKNFRLYIGNTATASADADFTKVVNENSLTLKGSADIQENETKEGGLERNPGNVSWEISGDFNEVYTDTGLVKLEDALNQPWAYQIRDTSGEADTVWMEGEFILSDIEYKAETKDVRSGTFTLKSSGDVTRNRPTRALEA